ncbi:MBL fold metallo-hydrolase [Gracilimonas mengyeensis]|uniref:Glyoxylase, beta-lactamase superfamily II n=1 Tax=Gracilimonas mengyeensis TaxID=1302730 RepID=A0A521E9V0_9BACT|nr:MBL fold metallo-hydrolase [Gracilimonas mengyeensis]SMO80693.1 Glyoxylase, beta-lactamase superfamily II [Gracilimonas mengyeensis]
MQVGRFNIEQLSEGVFEVFEDGIIQKAEHPVPGKPLQTELSTKRPVSIGINPILVSDGKHHVLLDTGLGWGLDHKSQFTDTSNLLTNLEIFGLTPSDITHVVLSHLHYDHAAGSTYVDERTSTCPTMSYANYFIQKKEWYFALEQMSSGQQMAGAGYNLDEFYKLAAEDKLVMITDEAFELLPGIDIIRTGGHTPGHQIVKIHDGGEVAYYLGDLVPSEYHLNHYAMRQLDVDPVQSKKAKTLILRQASKENALMLFYHSIHAKTGKLERGKDKNFVLRDIKR